MMSPTPDNQTGATPESKMTSAEDYQALAGPDSELDIHDWLEGDDGKPVASPAKVRDILTAPSAPEQTLGQLEFVVAELEGKLAVLAKEFGIATDESGQPIVGDNHRWFSAEGPSVPLDHHAFIEGGPLASDLADGRSALAKYIQDHPKTEEERRA